MRENYDHLWANEAHWRWRSIYVCPEDPRIVVFKKRKWAGWTFNFAHRVSFYLLAFVLVMSVAPALVILVIDLPSVSRVAYAVLFSALVVFSVMLGCWRIGRS